MDQFVALHGMTRRRHGLPPQPASFFRNIERELIATGAGFVVTAETGGRAAAAAVFLHSGTAGIYKFSASDRSCWELRPNNLVVWEGICALVREGVIPDNSRNHNHFRDHLQYRGQVCPEH